MLDSELGHGEVARVARGQPAARSKSGRRDQAVRLGERRSRLRVVAAPRAGTLPGSPVERYDEEPFQQPLR